MKIFFKKTEKILSTDNIKETSKTEKYCRIVKTWSKQNKVIFMIFIIYNKKTTLRSRAKWMRITKVDHHKQIVFLRNTSVCAPNLY